MTMVGANADALDQAAAVLNAAADQLDADSAKLHRTLRGVSWLGAVATAFMHVFEGDHQPRLHTTANFIRDAARKLNTNARQQRQASISGGGGLRGLAHTPDLFRPAQGSGWPELKLDRLDADWATRTNSAAGWRLNHDGSTNFGAGQFLGERPRRAYS